jgi:integrase
MPVAKRGAAWQITICHKGQVYRRSYRHWTREKAVEVERKWLNEIHDAEIGRRPRYGFLEAVERWTLEELPRHKDPDRERSHMAALAPFLEGRMLEDGPDIAGEIKQEWRNLAPATVNRRLALLRRLLSLAYQWGWLASNIGDKVKMLPVRNERHVYLTDAQVRALAKKMPRSGGYVLLAAYTGIRRGQLLGLTADQVRDNAIWLGSEGKTAKAQKIPLHKNVREIAEKLPLCTDQVLRDEWEVARGALKLGHVRFHDLRHTAASWLLQAGADLLLVRTLLGHTDSRTTERYAHHAADALKKAIDRI